MSTFKRAILRSGAILALVAASAAQANPVVLDFEGLATTYPYGAVGVGNFYDGGTSGDGVSGPNFGISFTSNALALCLNTAPAACSNTSRGGQGSPTSQKGGLIWLDGPQTFMNVAAGFDTGFSFLYSAPFFPGSVSVFDGLDGTGNLLGSIALGTTPAGSCNTAISHGASYCPFLPVGVSFAGTAKSVSFAGTANYIVFDDVTFGSATPGPSVPEPATWAMMIGGFGIAGAAIRRRNRQPVLA